MNAEQKMVHDFHKVTGAATPDAPMFIDPEESQLALNLIKEELIELDEAIFVDGDMLHVMKEAADLLYVVYGFCLRHGIDIEPIFAEVHKSNMSKIMENGAVMRRHDGKILKPDTYIAPDMAQFLKD